MRQKRILVNAIAFFIVFSVIFNFNILSYATEDYVWNYNLGSVETSATDSESNIENPLNLQCGAAILIDQNSGQVLYEHNSHEKLRPASVTKVMSILLVMEALDSGQIKLEDRVPCSEKASSMGGSQIWLTTSEALTVNEMLKCMCVVSANDCTVAMAEYLCGSTDAFVEKMNQRAKELGMNDTCFKNCHGIDEDGHETSAYDIALMSRELLNNHPSITNYTTIWMDSIRDGKSELVNTNKLVRNYEGCTGLKTGSTSLALYNLSASATRDNLSLIAVVMKAPTTALRFSEAKALLDYGFNNYSSSELGKKDDIVKCINVEKGVENNLNGLFSKNEYCLIPKGKESEIRQEISIPDSIQAPVSKGEKIGEIKYYYEDKQLCSIDVISDRDVRKNSLVNMSGFLLRKWFSLLRL